ncbi:Rne/Rng family ribonuclease [Rhodobacteraceae bacterium 2CG4]|uniref:Ribonuclease E n=1 Tax=Halovulum marinum TaxID=2662447 RepID=A0A6L5YZC7_9RHOB|nr:ribonuclease E/G [Halovulum marinum]MSU89064.1 Rne/Rng family ribonuclease [Halovulum marinum]
MPKKMLIDATHAEETRVVVVEGNKVDEFDFESLNKRQLAGNIYLAKVTRVEPSLQAAFIDYGGNRHGFLAFSEIHPDYYQIPVADREALLAEEQALDRAESEEDEEDRKKPSRGRSRSRSRGRSKSQPSRDGAASAGDAVLAEDLPAETDESTLVEDLPETAGARPRAEAADGASDPEASETPSASQPEPAQADDAADASRGGDDTDAADDAHDDAHAETDAEAADAKVDEVDTVGADDPKEDIAPRRPRPRRYKIQEVIKVRQILLVQVVKEERGNKGAALTTYLSLAGRYCVLMPNTARGGGISRKITNAPDRKKLKEIASEITVPQGAGLIIRTAGAKRTKTEIKRDYEYLLRQWEQIRDLTLRSIAPAHIYEEGSLIKRSIRDLYSRDIDEVLVEGESGYREAKDYMKMLMPSHARNVKLYTDPLPLFARFQVENYLTAMFNPTVQLRSGGYIVIDVTEALVAVDVNSGRSTKEGSIEETALKTNLEAAEEVARQARLRDLAGLIVIDFIDMDDRRNNASVEKRLKDKLKTDRARIQVGRISSFGLLEMSRQRLRPGMLEATTAPCSHCHGTGRVRSSDSLGLAILRELEEEGVRQRAKEVLVACPVEIANYLLNAKRDHIAMIEGRFGLSVRVEGRPAMISPDYEIQRFSTASRAVPQAQELETIRIAPIADLEDETVEEPEEIPAERPAAEAAGDDGQQKKKKRRRRRRGGKNRDEAQHGADSATDGAPRDTAVPAEAPAATPASDNASGDVLVDAGDAAVHSPAEAADDNGEPAPRKPRARSRKRKSAASEIVESASETVTEDDDDDNNGNGDIPVGQAAEESIEPAETPEPEPALADAAATADSAAGADTAPEAWPSEAPAPVDAQPAETHPAGTPPAETPPAGAAARQRKPRVRASAKETIEAVVGAASAVMTGTAPAAEADRVETDRTETDRAEPAAPQPATEAEDGGEDETAGRKRGWWSRALSSSE